MRFNDRIVMVTGGNSGIGRGIVHRFVKDGARVAFAGRNRHKGAEVEAEALALGGHATFFPCDLADEDAVRDLISKVAEWGGLHILINNAGVGSRRSGIEDSDGPGARWDKMRGPNLDSTFFASSHALPVIRHSAARSSTYPRRQRYTAIGASTAWRRRRSKR